LAIVITGGAGFIGSHLAQRLLSLGREIVIVDSFNNFYNPELKRRNIDLLISQDNQVDVEEVDIGDFEALESVFRKYLIDQVVHLAAYAGVTPSVENPRVYEEVNIGGTLNLLELCTSHGIQNFTFASSSSVYGGNPKVPFREGDPVNTPISPYAATKRAAELLCYTYCHLHGMNIPCLRFFTVYGPRQRPEMAVVKFIRHILQDKEILLYADGEYRRDYTYIDDIINGLIPAMGRRNGFEIFNLGGSRTTSTLDLVRTIEGLLGLEANLLLKPGRPGEVDRTFADVSQSEKILGYHPKMTLEEGLAVTVEWYRNLGYHWE
jgi:UDP-glucuronate 4-epimerase